MEHIFAILCLASFGNPEMALSGYYQGHEPGWRDCHIRACQEKKPLIQWVNVKPKTAGLENCIHYYCDWPDELRDGVEWAQPHIEISVELRNASRSGYSAWPVYWFNKNSHLPPNLTPGQIKVLIDDAYREYKEERSKDNLF